MMGEVTALLDAMGAFLKARLLPIVLLALLCLVAYKILMKMLGKVIDRLTLPVSLKGILRGAVRVVLLFLAVVIILGYLGVPVTSLVAAMSVVGVAVSLSVQNFLSNVMGGLQLMGSRPFVEGDYVEAGECSGVVQEVGLFYTKMLTPDNKLVQMPNSTVVSSNIINYTNQVNRRVDLTVTASYEAPVEQVEQVLLAILTRHPLVLDDPAPLARVSRYGPSSIEYTVRGWCKNEDYWDVYFDLVKAVKVDFDANGIPMTYDHLNVHVVDK